MGTDATSTSRVRLRDVIDADLPVFFAQQCEPEAIRMAAFPSRDRAAFMAHWSRIRRDAAVTIRTILVDDHVAGNILSWQWNGKPLVGYWLGQSDSGRGVATAALRAFLEVFKPRPVYARVARQNVASIRVLEKCGFTICSDETEAFEPPGDGVEEFVLKLA